MKTYTEAMANDKFDWYDALMDARAGRLTEDDHDELTRKAEDWTMCACGNMCDLIPRRETRELDNFREGRGSPLDDELRQLGMDFSEQVEEKDWFSAINTLSNIEYRSYEILNGMGVAITLETISTRIKANTGSKNERST